MRNSKSTANTAKNMVAKKEGNRDIVGKTTVCEEEMEYRNRYRQCRRLMEKWELIRSMTEEEKDELARKMAASEYLDLTCDWAFKYVFQSHPNLLILLLNDILQESITSVEFQNTERLGLEPIDKKVVFDLLCKTSDGSTFLCEMQKTTRSDQRDRLFYYGSRLVAEQMNAGDKKYVLSPVKVVCIMNYEDSHTNSPEDKILYQYHMLEIETGEAFGNQMSFHLLELPRIMRYAQEFDSPVAGWCRIFRNFSIFARTAAANAPWFKELEGAMRIRGLSNEQIENYFSDMISKDEMLPYLEGSELQGYRRGLREGKAEGKAEGIAEGKAEVAMALLGIGMPLAQIVSVTGLTAEQVKALK